MENGDRMKFFEMIRKTTIVQRILIGGSIVWILWKPPLTYCKDSFFTILDILQNKSIKHTLFLTS